MNAKSPERYKSTYIKATGSIKGKLGIEASRIQHFDKNRTFVKMKKGDAIALIDKENNVLELSRDKKGHFDVRELRRSRSKNESKDTI